jgi:hypothetical protein
MRGIRKLLLGTFYLVGMMGIGTMVAYRSPEHLGAMGLFASGVATGLAAIVWGNIREHQANVAAGAPQSENEVK